MGEGREGPGDLGRRGGGGGKGKLALKPVCTC